KKTLYDLYIESFRWASDRLDNKGVIAFVSNGQYIDSIATSGLREHFLMEFNKVYVLNLRGNARTSGELRKKEAGNIFGSGSRTSIAITILIKDNSNEHKIFYHDIGDYLNTNDKIAKLRGYDSLDGVKWERIIPDKNHDWVNQRDDNYSKYTAIVGEADKSLFVSKVTGVNTSRDYWSYSFSKENVSKNIQKLVENYNIEVEKSKNNSNYEMNMD